jgi:uncharacterized protein YfdQ (DUF2303 family)
MDSSAIDAIRDLTAAERANNVISDHPAVSIPLAIVPDSHKLLDLEKYTEQPARFRGLFGTLLIQEFISYINENGSSSTGIFVNPEEAQAQAIINMGYIDLPQWGDHKAALNLKKSPEFGALLSYRNSKMNQQEFIDFAEDWSENIQFIDEQHINIDFKTAINAIRRLTVSATQNSESNVGNFSASQSSLDAIEVKAAGTTPPYAFIFRFTPYDSFTQRTLVCQIRALTDCKAVNLKYRITGLDQHIDSIGQEFKALLNASITVDGIVFYTGTMQYQK